MELIFPMSKANEIIFNLSRYNIILKIINPCYHNDYTTSAGAETTCKDKELASQALKKFSDRMKKVNNQNKTIERVHQENYFQ